MLLFDGSVIEMAVSDSHLSCLCESAMDQEINRGTCSSVTPSYQGAEVRALSSGRDFSELQLPFQQRCPEVIMLGIESGDGGRRLIVEYFAGLRPLVGIGYDQSQYPLHSDVYGGVWNALMQRLNTPIVDELFGSQKHIDDSSLIDLLGAVKVDGFVEKRDGIYRHFVVRIEDESHLLLNVARVGDEREFIEKVKLYGAALKTAGILANQVAGSVSIMAETESALLVAEILGALHLVETGTMGRANLQRLVTQSSDAGEFYYSHATGRRFKTPTQLEQLKNDIADYDKTISSLEAMVKLMHPDNQNCHGQLEYQFLLYDANCQDFNESGDDQAKLYESLKHCLADLRTISSDKWASSCDDVKKCLDGLIEYHRYFCGSPFDKDDFADAKFARALEKRLCVGEEFLKLDRSVYSTPQHNLELGAFDLHTGEFCFATQDLELNLIASWFYENLPKDRTYRRLSVFVPDSDLTFNQRSATSVRHWGDPADESFVIRAGGLIGGEIADVIRRHPFPPDYWRDCKTVRAAALANQFRGQEELLTSLVSLYMQSQIDAFNRFVETRRVEYHYTLENWQPLALSDEFAKTIANKAGSETRYFLRRPLIPGERNDLKDWMRASFSDFANNFAWSGRNAVPNFLLQRAVFPIREHLSNAKTGMITSIGSGESLCDGLNLDPEQQLTDYLHKSAYIYGAHLFQLQASFRYGEDAQKHGYSTRDIEAIVKTFTQSFSQTFKSFFEEQAARGSYDGKEIEGRYHAYTKAVPEIENTIPAEFDIRPELKLSNELLVLSENEIAAYIYRIEQISEQMNQWYDNYLCGKHYQLVDISPEEHTELIESFRALLVNHLAHPDVFNEMRDILKDEERKFRLIPVKQKQWLLALADVTAWLGEVGIVSGEDLSEAVSHYSSARKFALSISRDLEGVYLSKHTAARFYEAMRGLTQSLDAAPPYTEAHKRLRRAIARCSFGQNLGFS